MVITFADVKSLPSYLYGVIVAAVLVMLAIIPVTVVVIRKKINNNGDKESQDEGTKRLNLNKRYFCIL